MQRVVARLLAEHDQLAGLVRLLDRQPSLVADPAAPNIALLVDALSYLTQFPDVSHHALEDRIGERLSARGALDASISNELSAQHATLAHQGRDLLRDLESAARDEAMPRELLQSNIRLYAERLRHNMAVEELTLFPAALQCLSDDDWSAIAGDIAADPLFRTPVEERFADLRRVIEAESGEGPGG